MATLECMDAEPGGCQEASPLSVEDYLPCNKPARHIVKTRDPEPYRMCDACADHNIRHRGAKLVGPYSG